MPNLSIFWIKKILANQNVPYRSWSTALDEDLGGNVDTFKKNDKVLKFTSWQISFTLLTYKQEKRKTVSSDPSKSLFSHLCNHLYNCSPVLYCTYSRHQNHPSIICYSGDENTFFLKAVQKVKTGMFQ